MPGTANHRSRDPCTVSNYDIFKTRHITANFEIDFEKQRLHGDVLLKMEKLEDVESPKIVLDSRFLAINEIKVNGSLAEWSVKPNVLTFGDALSIKAGQDIRAGGCITLSISVSTTKDCTALQWLTPLQTSNKKHPYVFSQCQAIHARSIFPCQDTPDVKATVEFNIRSHLPVIASGVPVTSSGIKEEKQLYRFVQETPIPSYLFAIASGDIAFAKIGPRSQVATGPGELEAAKWELEEDMERFIQIGEEILKPTPYVWGSYNALILPPSFPFGGMENPVFTFATPSIISGDRQNVDVIAHELSHSWSGNLVSNSSWEHFWLNEGWTVYLERRIVAALHGEPARSFSAIIGWKAFSDSVKFFGPDHEFTKLVVDLKGSDPDDAFSSIPYEKGFNFLYYLEGIVGQSSFDGFISHYFAKFARKSLDSYEFKDAFVLFFADNPTASAAIASVDWEKWYHSPGLPDKPDFDTSLADFCYALAVRWASRATGDATFVPALEDISHFSGNQIVVFLEAIEQLDQSITAADAHLMGEVYGFAHSKNLEIVTMYFRVALQAGDKNVLEPTADMLGKIGRMKFVRPLYRSLTKVDRKLALETFARHKEFYHPICRQMVEKDLFGGKK